MIRKFIDNLEEILGIFFLGSICLIVGYNVLSRYLFMRPNAWAEELCRYFFAYLVFIGASLALKRREHFAIDYFIGLLSENKQYLVSVMIDILVLLMSIIIFWYGIKSTIRALPITTPAMELTRAVPYASVPFGGLLLTFRSIELLIKRVISSKKIKYSGGSVES